MDKEEQTLFRFLRARKMNVEAAADMLQSKALNASFCEYMKAMQPAANGHGYLSADNRWHMAATFLQNRTLGSMNGSNTS